MQSSAVIRGEANQSVFLALVEHELEAGDADDDQAEADVIDLDAARLCACLSQGGSSTRREVKNSESSADRQVDEEDPVPVEVVGNPTAQRGADGGRDHHGHAVNRECHAALFSGEGIGQNGLLGRLQSAAARALQNARDDEERQIGRDAAEERDTVNSTTQVM